MALNVIKFPIVGYLREKYPTENFGNFQKRECIIRTVKKQKGTYTINDYSCILWNDKVSYLDPLLVGDEVIASVKLKGAERKKDGQIQRWKGKLSINISLIIEDIFAKPNGKIASDDIWKLPNGFVEAEQIEQYIKKDITTGDSLTEEDKERRFPNVEIQTIDNFNRNKDEQKEEKDELPF